MSQARELLRSVKNLSVLRELAKTNGGLNSVGDLVANFIDSEAMTVCLQRFKSLPGGKDMVEQRYPPSNLIFRLWRSCRREHWVGLMQE